MKTTSRTIERELPTRLIERSVLSPAGFPRRRGAYSAAWVGANTLLVTTVNGEQLTLTELTTAEFAEQFPRYADYEPSEAFTSSDGYVHFRASNGSTYCAPAARELVEEFHRRAFRTLMGDRPLSEAA